MTEVYSCKALLYFDVFYGLVLQSLQLKAGVSTQPLFLGNLNSNYKADIATYLLLFPWFSYCCFVHFRKRQTHWGEVIHNIGYISLQFYTFSENWASQSWMPTLLFSVFICCFFLFPLIYVTVLSRKVKVLSCSIITQSGIISLITSYIILKMFVITLILENWF